MGIDLTFTTGEHRLNVRAAAVIIHDGYILCDREEGIEWAYLPGGRIKRGESSSAALKREMREELDVDIEVRQPHFITESFYFNGDVRYHEMSFYYLVQKPEHLRFTPNEICHVHEESDVEFYHFWVPLTPQDLIDAQVQPVALHPHFIDLPATPVHVIIDEIGDK